MLSIHRNMQLEEKIVAEFEASIAVKRRIVEECAPVLSEIVMLMVNTLRAGGKVLLFGNGGSAADSQHFAAELVSRFRRERRSLPAIALTTDTSILTAIANDYSFEDVFTRQIESLGEEGDLAIGISTSGNSANVLKAVAKARAMGMATVALTGETGGKLTEQVDICLRVPSMDTARIQESHITAAHTICELVEREFCEGDGQS